MYGCVADEYGYFPTSPDSISAAKSYSSPTLQHIHDISTASGSLLDEFTCPYSYNMRILDPSSDSTGSAVFTGSWTATTLTVTAVASGKIEVGQILTGTSLAAATRIVQFLTGEGGPGTYLISIGNSANTVPAVPQPNIGSNVVITATSSVFMNFRKQISSLTCSATHGYFQLRFRGKLTSKLFAKNTTVFLLEKALESLPTIGEVTVSIDGGNSNSLICSAVGVVTKVQLDTEIGRTPLFSSVLPTAAVATASWPDPASNQTNKLTVTAVSSGAFYTGQSIFGTGIQLETWIYAYQTGTGNTGSYLMSSNQAAAGTGVAIISASFANAKFVASWTGTTLTVSAVTFGKLTIGSYLYGIGISSDTRISALGSGAGETGTYTLSKSQGADGTNVNIISSGVLSVQVATDIGTKNALYECGGKGTCDRKLGQCNCWDNWVSSDGFGNNGIIGDCGHNLIY